MSVCMLTNHQLQTIFKLTIIYTYYKKKLHSKGSVQILGKENRISTIKMSVRVD